MGLDIVRHRLQALHGDVGCAFEPGRGTRITITVPLVVGSMRALLVGVAGQVFAFPAASVRRLVRVGAAELRVAAGRELLLSADAPMPVAALADVLGITRPAPHVAGRRTPLLIAASGADRMAFAVDELIAEDQVIVKPLGPRLRGVRHFTGATILPSGRLALVLNATDLLHTALSRSFGPPLPAPAKVPATRPRLLVVDDSVTTRSLERSLLEAAGYDVTTAADGREAWRLLQAGGADLVVADVEMPRMDGFALCEAIRGSARFRDLPVVLVTALESAADRRRGLDAGADAYLAKSGFDQRHLLDAVADLLSGAR
jgi:two-component system chemotaxis sensor kinase CheA